MESFKQKFTAVVSKKNIFILLIVLIFLVVAIYIYRRYISQKLNKNKYVANSEFSPEGTNKPTEIVTLYFFYTDWCPHCKKSKPIWNSLKEELENKEFKGVNINFVEVDCDKEPALAEKFNVQGYPTIKLVKGNQIIEYDAKPSRDTLMEFLQTSL
jgi:thiol-disulfide isomerase/thioredoxin